MNDFGSDLRRHEIGQNLAHQSQRSGNHRRGRRGTTRQFGGLSGDGNTAIVGGPLGNPRAGATWVYTRRFLPGQTSSEATGVSADGKVVVGRSWKTEDLTTSQAYRWSFRVMTRSGVPAPFFAAWMTFKALQ
jgi:probable HAF family extracellular repeat protein